MQYFLEFANSFVGFDYSANEYCIKRYIEKVDNILSSIRSFQECSRSPRKMINKKTWKANEWQNWLLLYCSVCLKGFLPKKYVNHFQLLVLAIEKLLNTNVTEQDILESGKLLNVVVEDCEILYGIDEMKYNVHLLLHIPSCLSNFGPLWAFSLFCFEDMNGVLKKFIKGPKQPVIQIARRCLLAQKRETIDLKSIRNDKVREFCESFNNYNRKISCINNDINIKNHESALNEQIPQSSFEEHNFLIRNRYTFKPVKKSTSNSDDAAFTMNVKGDIIYGVIQRIYYSDFDSYILYKLIIVHKEEGLLIGIITTNKNLVKVNDC
ncbi:uncharacterized protein LOC131436962 [Malaya genurostris]|uniref:uncharacterized protein LOC131436962 n=1 Tax=Malaya genurostris TaxID=325434 RepID=UPI0026F3C0F8|nr:uncharacterized protein LOC131436962 [Malaya genurostris]XP_058461954.1 uncharacterized protein LOC131436962 [Malaya genurostris]